MKLRDLTSDRALRAKQAAEVLDTSTSTLSRWRTRGRGPRYFKTGSTKQAPVRYLVSDLKAWLDEHMRRSTSDYGEQKGDQCAEGQR
jgi:predicted DNA-binding transcriptional regulator AlpA